MTAAVVAQVTQATLPFTGLPTSTLALIAVGLVSLGLVLVMISRRGEETTPTKPWN
ncbi:MAG: LPXTG cell wall anchor domain-containing protein [Acidimicrobiia bacterium]